MSTRAGFALWVAIWAVVAAVGLHHATNTTAQEPIPLIAEGTGTASLDGLSATVLSVDFRTSETVVTAVFDGREADGDTVALMGRTRIVDAAGQELRESRGSASGRTVTLHFPPASGAIATADVMIDFDSVALASQDSSVPSDEGVQVVGSYLLHVLPESLSFTEGDVRELSLSVPFGPGSLGLTQIIYEPATTTILGTLTGFSPEMIQELSLGRGILARLADGQEVTVSYVRSGFGEQLAGVRIVLGQVAPTDELRLRIPFTVSDNPHDAEVAESLSSWSGEVTDLDIPAMDQED